jgi:hypothetical protein
MIVFTGDQLNGQGTTWDTKSVFAKFAVAATERQIPWAAVFGNHDDEDGALKDEQVKMLQALPYSLVESGPKDVHGVGNYVLKIKSADPLSYNLLCLLRTVTDGLLNRSKTHLLTLYFLDSGSYSKGYLDWFGFFKPTEYDYLHQVGYLMCCLFLANAPISESNRLVLTRVGYLYRVSCIPEQRLTHLII